MLALSAQPKVICHADGAYTWSTADGSEDRYEPSLTRVLSLALRMVSVPLGYIFLSDGTWVLMSPDRSLDKHTQALVREQLDAYCADIIQQERTLSIPDLHTSCDLTQNEHILRAYIGAPIVLNEHIVGAFCLAAHAPQAWRDEEARLIAELSTVVAMELRLRDDLQILQRVERELSAVRRLEQFSTHTRCLAHDVANMLVAVVGNAELALLDLPSESPVCDSLQTIRSAAARAATLNRQLLRYAHGAEPDSERDTVDLNTIVRETVAAYRPVVPPAVAITTALAPDLPPLHMSPAQMGRVVLNLLVNAADAIGNKAGTIVLSTKSDVQGQVHLNVVDTGCGMDANTLAHIFEPHYTTKPNGHGLGLGSVRAIVQEQGGTIEAVSVPLRGTTMTINLPCVAHYPQEVEALQPLLAYACGDSSGT